MQPSGFEQGCFPCPIGEPTPFKLSRALRDTAFQEFRRLTMGCGLTGSQRASVDNGFFEVFGLLEDMSPEPSPDEVAGQGDPFR